VSNSVYTVTVGLTPHSASSVDMRFRQVARQMPVSRNSGSSRLDWGAKQRQDAEEGIPLGKCRLKLLREGVVMAENPNLDFLDYYDADGKTVYCWKRWSPQLNEELASEEFSSEDLALDAWRDNKLTWSKLSDLGD